MSDADYRGERTALERELRTLTPDTRPAVLPNLERAAQLLNELPSLWKHPGVSDERREALVQEVCNQMTIDGRNIVAVEPKVAYLPLFAAMLAQEDFGYRDLESTPSHDTQEFLPSGVKVLGLDDWLGRLAKVA